MTQNPSVTAGTMLGLARSWYLMDALSTDLHLFSVRHSGL
jgi:hypothetical protein